MKKYKVLLIIVITAIISTISTVIADSIINSNKVTYNDTTLDRALDSVYSNLNTITGINNFGTVSYATSQGTPQKTRTLTKEITKGKYIILTIANEGWDDPGSYAATSEVSNIKKLSCESNNCDIRVITGYHNQPKATGAITTYYKTMMYTTVTAYYVDIKEDTDIISTYASADRTYTTGVQSLTFHVIKVE